MLKYHKMAVKKGNSDALFNLIEYYKIKKEKFNI